MPLDADGVIAALTEVEVEPRRQIEEMVDADPTSRGSALPCRQAR